MESAFLCIAFFVVAAYAAHSNPARGLGAVVAIGFVYGILRANLNQTAGHFLFDSSVVGLYLGLWTRSMPPAARHRVRRVLPWVLALTLWPCLMFFVPRQDPMVQLVGLRGHIFFVPFIVIGAMLDREDYFALGTWLAILNIGALALGIAEASIGVPHFFPKNALTEIIYNSTDVTIGFRKTTLRIPSSFANAASYSGTMVATVPILVGAWMHERRSAIRLNLLRAGLLSALIGVFLGASRSAAVIMIALAAILVLSGALGARQWIAWIMVTAVVGFIVARSARLERFTTLTDTGMVEKRVSLSANTHFLDVLETYPLGNGLGAGGTSLPYFLQKRLHDPIPMENEYSRILVEQGLPGLLLWVSFIGWVFVRGIAQRRRKWDPGRNLAWYFCMIIFATAFMGIGMLTAIPESALMLMMAGWVAAPQMRAARAQQAQAAVAPRRGMMGPVGA